MIPLKSYVLFATAASAALISLTSTEAAPKATTPAGKAATADVPHGSKVLRPEPAMATKVVDVGTGPGSTTAPKYGTWGYDEGGRDTSVKPGDNFFRYANGTALDRMEIPSDRSRFGNFDVLTVLSENRVRAILNDVASRPEASLSPEERKVAEFYKAYMDEKAVEARGAAPLQPDLDAVRAITNKAQLAAYMGRSNKGFGASIFGVGIGADAKDPDRYAVYMRQAGLGLPDRDYYLKPEFAEKKQKYQAYVAQMLTLAGWPNAETAARSVVDFETKLAQAHWTRVEGRDRDKTYNAMSPEELAKTAPGFDWNAMMRSADLGQVRRVIVAQNTAFPKMADVFAKAPLDELKAWEAFHIVDGAAPFLPQRFVQARFEFRNKTLAGQPELQARWKRAVIAENGALGEALGKVYVERYFTPAAKAQMLQLVGNIKTALKGRIEKLAWMTPATKTQALDKLSKFNVKIAYPDKWRDYSPYAVKDQDLYGNMERAEAYDWAYDVNRMNGPVDRQEWGMTPQTVNAYYNSTMNEIVFPAAILAPPFFDPNGDPAINYGGIGGVIGHEISHGFDDQGRKSDGSGRLHDWWTPADATAFKARTDKLGAQYSAFEPLPGAHISGDLTMGENIGDMGGINLALAAYHASLHGKPAPVIDGLTGDQRVFLGWAQVWRGKSRPDALRQQLVTDPHSPPEARVNGVVRNVDAWYTAFNVKPGDKLYVAPADRVKIW